VERALKPNSLGGVVLIRVDPGTLKAVKTAGPITELGIARNERGHLDWTEKLDWHR
jgi:hypothetical protein